MTVSIKNHTALITGASRGIGASIALALAQEGCNLALTARNTSKLGGVAAKCRSFGIEVNCIAADMTKPEEVFACFEQCVALRGGLDILVNNAGVFNRGPLAKLTQIELDEMLAVNLASVIQLTKLAVPQLIAATEAGRRAAVINIASRAGKFSFAGSSGYCATKHGVVGFSNSVFQDLREYGVKVCAINPSYTATDMVEGYNFRDETMIQSEEVAELARMICTWPPASCPTEILLETQILPVGKQVGHPV